MFFNTSAPTAKCNCKLKNSKDAGFVEEIRKNVDSFRESMDSYRSHES